MKNSPENFTKVAEQAGMALMTLAACVGMIEMPDHAGSRIVVPNQPAFAMVTTTSEQEINPLRREKEEVSAHYISYSEVQRTPARSGKQ